MTGDPSIVPINQQALAKALSAEVILLKYDGRSKDWKPCDPPPRLVGILYSAQAYKYLPNLLGPARQPYFREADGKLVMQSGYDAVSNLYGVFDPAEYVPPLRPTKETAQVALAMLTPLIDEFPFQNDYDRSAALAGILTATTRNSYALAPAFHVKAATIGSGKSYLCELIAAFAGPADSAKVSYPSTAEEAGKSILALLLQCLAVIEFDDMVDDWKPFGIINRMLTAPSITDRVLGASKTATVSTRTLFLSSGNNVGPVRDTRRRVVTIHLDHQSATPSTTAYKRNPVAEVRKNRGAYVAAALTIIQAWRNAGSPRADVSNIASYGGAWADYARHPLIWLGLPDPATSLLEQVRHDPDAEALGTLLAQWYRKFGTRPTTIRKVIEVVECDNEDLHDAISEFPIVERGQINRSKFGWLLSRNVNRVVGGLKFQEAWADSRKAWQVVVIDPTSMPTNPGRESSADESDLY